MAYTETVETIHGKYSKFEIVRKTTSFSTKFWIYKDGKHHRGPFSSLSDAVAAAKEEG